MDEPILQAAFPLELTGGDFAMVEQDTDADLFGRVMSRLRCPRGWVDSDPAFGRPELLGQPGGPDLEQLRAALQEPGVELLVDADLEQLVRELDADLTVEIRRADA